MDHRQRETSRYGVAAKRVGIGPPAQQPEPGRNRNPHERERQSETHALAREPAARWNALRKEQPQGAIFPLARDAAVGRENHEQRTEQLQDLGAIGQPENAGSTRVLSWRIREHAALMRFEPEHATGCGLDAGIKERERQFRFREIESEVRCPMRVFFPLILPLLAGGRLEMRALVRLAPKRLPAEQRKRSQQAERKPRGRAQPAIAAELPEFVSGNRPEHGSGELELGA